MGKDYVYFIEDAKAGQIKIGRSSHPRIRVTQLRTETGRRLSLLGVTQKAEEKDLHDLLAAYRVEGEWFRDCGKVRSVISGLIEDASKTPGWLALRLPDEHVQQLHKLAKKTRRSVTEEAKIAFETHLAASGLWPPSEDET